MFQSCKFGRGKNNMLNRVNATCVSRPLPLRCICSPLTCASKYTFLSLSVSIWYAYFVFPFPSTYSPHNIISDRIRSAVRFPLWWQRGLMCNFFTVIWLFFVLSPWDVHWSRDREDHLKIDLDQRSRSAWSNRSLMVIRSSKWSWSSLPKDHY